MLQPKKTRYRKTHRGVLKGKATRGNTISFGEYGLKATTHGFINSRQIEAARKVIARTLKRGGKVWIRVFPHKPYTKKPLEVPMGGGKGGVEFYVAPTKPGHVLFEIAGVDRDLAMKALSLAGDKLPVKTKVVEREEHIVSSSNA